MQPRLLPCQMLHTSFHCHLWAESCSTLALYQPCKSLYCWYVAMHSPLPIQLVAHGNTPP